MQITAATLSLIAGTGANDNMRSSVAGLQRAGIGAGLERPQRLAMYLGQLSHESMGWYYDREIWGPSAAQKRYEGRTDLGNTQPGDGSRFRGRGPIQITGRYNYQKFTEWARAMDPNAPDFVTNPDAVNTDPWEGLVAIWYWERHNLNTLADRGDYETLTRRINGGLNGYADRQARYARAALVLMGRKATGVREYQMAVGLSPDGVAGPLTLASMHKTLASMPPVNFGAVPVSDAAPAAPSTPATNPIAALFTMLARIFGAKS